MTPQADTYKTIVKTGEGLYTESRSRFLAFAHHVNDEAEAKALLAQYRKQYYDARHVCFAYALGSDGSVTRHSDDGEPAGTAGAPLDRQLRSFELTYALLVVVRYFGGVKLGTSRLGTAYKTAAIAALEAAEIEEQIMKAQLTVEAPYADADVAMRYVREAGADIVARDYTPTSAVMTISVRQRDEAALRSRLAKILSLKFVDDDAAEEMAAQ